MKYLSFLFCLQAILLLLSVEGCAQNQKGQLTNAKTDYWKTWTTFHTQLTTSGAAPDAGKPLIGIDHEVEVIEYPSNGLKLQAFLHQGLKKDNSPRPALVFLHGGNTAYLSAITICQAYLNAGFAVMVPSFRGENQNPGNYELLKGEVDDAKAAIKWLAQQPYVDKNQIYVFGHSMGGGIALALSLHPDVPMRLSGSCAGVFDVQTFEQWDKSEMFPIPFNYHDQKESLIRCPVYFLEDMQRTHYLYIGSEDYFKEMSEWIHQLYPQKNIKLIQEEVSGDHFKSLAPALTAFLKAIKPDAARNSQRIETNPTQYEPNAAWLKDFSQAPQIALTNEAYMKGKRPMIGASSFLVEYNEKVYGVTAKHLIQENGGGYKPPIKASELNTVCASWMMYPRTVTENFIKMDKLLNTADYMKEDVLIFSINGTVPATVKPLKVRKSSSLPREVWLIGCPYSETDCKQNLYHASVITMEQGYIIAQNLQPQVNIQGFSGAPVVDENGEVVGSASFSAEDNLIVIPSLLPVLQKTVGN